MSQFYLTISWLMIKSFTKAVVWVEAAIAVILFGVLLCNQEIGRKWLGWDWGGFDPRWSWLPIGIVASHLFLKAIYDRYCDLERLNNVEIKNLQEQLLVQAKNDNVAAVREGILGAVASEYSAEWRIETRNMLRGSMGSAYVRKFNASLCELQPELSSKAYLRGLEKSVSGALLRDSRIASKNESHRFNDASDMIWELIERAPRLDVRFVPAIRNEVIVWRGRCVTTIQNLLNAESWNAWINVFAPLGIVETQEPDEVRAVVIDAVHHLRLIYSKLDKTMLSTTFGLTGSE